MGEWVRFKLDQQTDHILVDEAQDTNASSGASSMRWPANISRRGRQRAAPHLFTVGDFKQAIFSFQGPIRPSSNGARSASAGPHGRCGTMRRPVQPRRGAAARLP
jgi:hypothetical protein